MDDKEKSAVPLIERPFDLNGSRLDEVATLERGTSTSQGALPTLWLLWGQRQLLWRFAAWGLLMATLLAFLIPKQYESTARLMPPESDSMGKFAMLASIGGGGGAAGALNLGGIASNLLGVKNTGSVFVGILGSRTLQDRLISRFDLRKVYGVRKWEDARNKLGKRTNISEDRKSGIMSITVADRNPERAREMAQSYVDELNKLVAELSTSTARRERIFLEARLKEVQGDLSESEKTFSEFSSKNSTLDIKEQGKAMLTAAAELEGELIAAETQLKGLEQIYTSNNVRVRTAQARVNELKRQLEKLGGTKAVTGKVATQDADTDMPYPSIRQLPLLGVTYADMYRHIRVQETVLEVLTREYELAKVEEVKEIPIVKLLDAPVIPENKSFPPRKLIIALGVLLSVLLGASYIVGAESWEQLDPAHPQKLFANEVLSTIRQTATWKKVRTWSRNGQPGGDVEAI